MLIELAAFVVLAVVLLLVFLLRRYGRIPRWPLTILVVASLYGLIQVWSWLVTGNDPANLVTVYGDSPSGKSDTLIVLVHGLGGPENLVEVRDHLKKVQADWNVLDEHPAAVAGAEGPRQARQAEVLVLDYGLPLWKMVSNTNPTLIAEGVSRQIEKAFTEHKYKRIVLVGNSMGALIARKAFLVARGRAVDIEPAKSATWANMTCRFVLLAGMNRGLDLNGPRPADMRRIKYGLFRALSNAVRWTHTGGLYLKMERGSPFVANLRLEWMRLSRELGDEMPGTVQLLGDIDDVVSDADNKDLRVAGSSRFTWCKVRGTGHAEIVHLGGNSPNGSDEKHLGEYRARKLEHAIVTPFAELRRENEEQPFEIDTDVKRVVFVLHGIRDLGQWSSGFEEAMRVEFRREQAKVVAGTVGLAAGTSVPGLAAWPVLPWKDGPTAKLVIVSPRYGYLPMAPFLLPSVRQKYVRWFMDEYTETLARYPAVEAIDFIGHSNGTYLLASALEEYPALVVDRVVFGGSVVRQDYRWDERIKNQQVKAVRNYVASDDLVVSLFPNFFDQEYTRWLGNDLGSAGFNGFKKGLGKGVENIQSIRGGHGALHEDVEQRRQDIVGFLLTKDTVVREPLQGRLRWLDGLSVGCIIVWLALACLLVLGGYGAILVSAACWLWLTEDSWLWLAASGWWAVMLRFLGALVCLLLMVSFFFAVREALLFFLTVALLAGLAFRWLPNFGQAVVLPKPTDIMPVVLAVGLAASFVFAGILDNLHDVGRLLFAAVVVVPGAVLLGLLVAALLPMPAAGADGPKIVWLVLASLLVVLEFAGLILLRRWEGLVVLVPTFVLGVLLVLLVQRPIASAKAKYQAGPPTAAIRLAPAPPINRRLELCSFAGVLVAPVYFTVILYVLLSF